MTRLYIPPIRRRDILAARLAAALPGSARFALEAARDLFGISLFIAGVAAVALWIDAARSGGLAP